MWSPGKRKRQDCSLSNPYCTKTTLSTLIALKLHFPTTLRHKLHYNTLHHNLFALQLHYPNSLQYKPHCTTLHRKLYCTTNLFALQPHCTTTTMHYKLHYKTPHFPTSLHYNYIRPQKTSHQAHQGDRVLFIIALWAWNMGRLGHNW